MAVAEQTPYKEYIANGVTTSFPLEFDCDDQDHLIVTVNDIEPENGQWSLINGAVVFLIAPANQVKIIIQRNTPLERNTNYQTTNNSFRPQPVNKDFDRIWWKLQEIWLQITLLWIGLKKEIKDRVEADLAIRSWVTILLNNIVDNGLVSAIAVTTVESVADLQYLVKWDGRTVYVKSYHAGINKGANRNFTFDSSRVAENDGCTVINGWVGQEKDKYTPWDFGYHPTNKDIATQAIKKCIESKYPIQLLAENLNNNDFVECVVDGKTKVIAGYGKSVSILNKVKIISRNGSFYYKGFIIFDVGVNYALFIEKYDTVEVDDFCGEINYDACLIWYANSEKSIAKVTNSIAIKSARIGFTTDIDAKNITFENLKTFDSRQGFHSEGSSNTKLINCEAIRCGNDAPTPKTDQPEAYAGGFRLHDYDNVQLINCKNITPAGRNIDWLGGGGTDLKISNCEGLKFLTDDVASGQIISYKNIEISDSSSCALNNQNYKSRIEGAVILRNLGTTGVSFDCDSTNSLLTTLVIDNVNCNRIQFSTSATEAMVFLDNVHTASQYWCKFSGFTYHFIGDISYEWLTGDDSQYPNIGYRFIANNAKQFSMQSFTSRNRGGGSQISLEQINTSKFKGGFIGKVIAANPIESFIGVDFSALNITYPRRGNQVLNTTDTSNTATRLNELLSSLRATGIIS